MAKAPPPNYTQSPNVYFDTWLKEINSLAELKVVNVIIRHTFGWHKENAEIGTTELMDLTGLSRVSVCEGVKRALEHGYIVRKTDGIRGLATFRIAVEMTGKESLPVEGVTGKEGLPVTGIDPLPLTGKDSLHAYKDKEKEKESRKKVEEEDPRGYPFDHFAVAQYCQAFKTELPIFQAETIATSVADSEMSRAVWADVLRTFTGNGYQKNHAGNAVDRYVQDMRKIASGKKDSPLPAGQSRTQTIRERMAG
jgi:hypothetical protein